MLDEVIEQGAVPAPEVIDRHALRGPDDLRQLVEPELLALGAVPVDSLGGGSELLDLVRVVPGDLSQRLVVAVHGLL